MAAWKMQRNPWMIGSAHFAAFFLAGDFLGGAPWDEGPRRSSGSGARMDVFGWRVARGGSR